MPPRQTRLTIRFEGAEPSIRLHRLSVSMFALSFDRLVRALRRIASGIDTDAWGSPEYGARGGRFTKDVEGLDWEIAEINGSSPFEVSGIVVQRFPSKDATLFEPPDSTELTDFAAERLLTALEKESSGHSYHKLVRRYLRSLPELTRQEYEVSTTRGVTLEPVVISSVELPEREVGLPYLTEVAGEVIGVGFEPGANEVRLKTEDDQRIALAATAEQVENALGLRKERVTAFYVKQPRPGRHKLLGIRVSSEERVAIPSVEAENHVFGRWSELLKRLAE